MELQLEKLATLYIKHVQVNHKEVHMHQIRLPAHIWRALCARTLPPLAYLLTQLSASVFICLIKPWRFLSYTS